MTGALCDITGGQFSELSVLARTFRKVEQATEVKDELSGLFTDRLETHVIVVTISKVNFASRWAFKAHFKHVRGSFNVNVFWPTTRGISETFT